MEIIFQVLGAYRQGCGSAFINADPDPAFLLIGDPDLVSNLGF
jgi:hypothetical protein